MSKVFWDSPPLPGTGLVGTQLNATEKERQMVGCYTAQQTHGREHDGLCDGTCRIRNLPSPPQWHGGTQANAITLLEQAMSCAIPEEAILEIGKIRDKLRRGAV